ncbi:CoA transferase [Hyphomicrobium sp. CS1BSMeth3]|uniref:CaiB/BaiF CoA transferase family protein n=1 Tax=Hyphomicrobium sp. CS1BSMeth3 TaxID=1892844 RepID=UPI000930CEFA|nr:CoA transferase [Hyphomicrobium sp. CS1BSMeth3]
MQAFSGLKVLDFTTTIAGPHCARLLADLGADVIKIETAEGDLMRSRPPLRNGASTSYGQLNAGKRSIVLDLKRPEAVAATRRLIGGADIIVENYRPGVTRRLGIDYASASVENPRLIYCSISGYGQTGPAADKPAYAPVVHATSGYDLAHIAYHPGRERPDSCGIFTADIVAGTYAFGAISAALYQRSVTGKGQHLDVSMFEGMLSLMTVELQASQFNMPPRPKRALYGPAATADGFVNIAVASERTFQELGNAAGKPWATDPRFAKYLDRRANWAEFMDELEEWTRTLTTSELMAVLDRHGVPAGPYRTVKEALADPQLAHRGAMQEVHDAAGAFKVLNPAFRMSASETQAGPRAPALGEHTREVLAAAGYSESEIAAITGT